MDTDELVHRFAYHPPRDSLAVDAHERVRREIRQVASRLDAIVPDGREKSLAVTHLEEAMMWANAGIARARVRAAVESAEA